MNSFNQLKVKKITDILGTLNKIMEIFKKMKGTSLNIGNTKKVKIMYNSLPLYAKLFIHPTAEYTPDQLFTEINKIILLSSYAG